MVTEFDDKGKFFTNVITKKSEKATIQTHDQRIHGEIHIRMDERILDELNKPDEFIAITNAIVFDLQGTPVYTTRFLAVNKKQIVWILPDIDMEFPTKENV